ncbi:MAG TPA: GNAT family N-acetyltransferase, partial [Candidatus Angelobacter sp.]|nr:GNAT family N-acetyltransferase [Candidatus Angelobacter sp.]
IYRSVEAMLSLRRLWEALYETGNYTVFQSFDLNLLAAARFTEREEPYVVCAESERGVAIVPAVLRRRDGTVSILGEELFDYRTFLHTGDDEVLLAAVGTLAELGRPLEIVALRESDRSVVTDALELLPFAAAPGVSCAQLPAEEFAAAHTRLARNLRRLERLGFELKSYDGANPQLLRSIYAAKAEQSELSLFHDAERVEFMVSAAGLNPGIFEIFTLENGGQRAAAVVTLRDNGCIRFYTGWFAAEYQKHSPALALIYEITRRSLAEGLDCDYMTGEQPYKMRLATESTRLYRVRTTANELAGIGRARQMPTAA